MINHPTYMATTLGQTTMNNSFCPRWSIRRFCILRSAMPLIPGNRCLTTGEISVAWFHVQNDSKNDTMFFFITYFKSSPFLVVYSPSPATGPKKPWPADRLLYNGTLCILQLRFQLWMLFISHFLSGGLLHGDGLTGGVCFFRGGTPSYYSYPFLVALGCYAHRDVPWKPTI